MKVENIIKLIVADGKQAASGPGAPEGREMQRYLIAALIASVPCLGVMTHYFGSRVLGITLASVLGAVAAELAFSAIRKKNPTGGSVAFGVLIALFVPPTVPLWMAFAGGAFGVFFGKEIFGGTGHHIFSPVAVGKAFVLFSFPKLVDKQPYFGSLDPMVHPTGDAWLVAAAVTVLGAVAMLVARPGNARILVGIAVAGLCVAFGLEGAGKLVEGESAIRLVTLYGFLLGACLVACDPSCAPRKASSQWLYGFVIGASAVLMSVYSNYTEGMMSAILFGNLLAPTLNALEETPFGRRTTA